MVALSHKALTNVCTVLVFAPFLILLFLHICQRFQTKQILYCIQKKKKKMQLMTMWKSNWDLKLITGCWQSSSCGNCKWVFYITLEEFWPTQRSFINPLQEITLPWQLQHSHKTTNHKQQNNSNNSYKLTLYK